MTPDQKLGQKLWWFTNAQKAQPLPSPAPAQVNTDFIQVDADTRDMLKELFLTGKPGESWTELTLPKVAKS